MRKGHRFLWLLLYIQRHEYTNVLDKAMVADYVRATGMRTTYAIFGADWCPQLSKDLGEMYRLGWLSRVPAGLTTPEAGFPRWVYVYSLTPFARKSYLEADEEGFQ